MHKDLTCEEAIQRMASYVDRDLSAEELELVQAHLDHCECCTNAFRFEDSILHFVKKNAKDVEVSDDFATKLFASLPPE